MYGESQADLNTPLFAHESLGGYEFVDDCFDHGYYEHPNDYYDPDIRRQSSRVGSQDFGPLDDSDLADPGLEKFPSDRSSIMGTLGTIQPSSSVDHSHFEDFLGASCFNPRSSIDSDSVLSSGSLSPTSTKKRDPFSTHSGLSRIKSTNSLGLIAEENMKGDDEEEDGDDVDDATSSLRGANSRNAFKSVDLRAPSEDRPLLWVED